MSKKKSMGHNPLSYSMRSHAAFDFIKKTDKASQETERRHRSGALGSSPLDNREPEVEVATNNKKVVSFYLEENLVSKIKDLAQDSNKSNSAFVNDFLLQSLN